MKRLPAFVLVLFLGLPATARAASDADVTLLKVEKVVEAAPGKVLESAWQDSLKNAKNLQEGQEVGRIGFYAPDIVIKGNMIDSITGPGYLYPQSK